MNLKAILLSSATAVALTGGMALAGPAHAANLDGATQVDEVAEGHVVVDGVETEAEDVSLSKSDRGELSSRDSIEAQGCEDWTRFVIPGTGKWYKSNNGCGFIGLDKSTTTGYSWEADPNTKGTACVQGIGYNGSAKAKWVFIGCGTKGSATVGWGNVSAVKKVRAKATNLPAGFAGVFR